MRDELYDRDYQDGRDALHDGIDRLVAAIGAAFRQALTGLTALNEIQFRAPWTGHRRHRSGA